MGFDVSNTSRFRLGAVQGGCRPTATSTSSTTSTRPTSSTLPSAAASTRRASRTIGGAFSQTQFSYGIFDLITGLRYDTYSSKGAFDCQAGTAAGGTPLYARSMQSDGRLNPKADAGRSGAALAAALRDLRRGIPGADHQRDHVRRQPPGRRPSPSFVPNPFLEPEVQKGWEFGANITQDRSVHARRPFRLKAAYFTWTSRTTSGCRA